MIVAGSGPARRRHHRLLRGAALRDRLGHAGVAGPAAVPRGRRHPARLRRLPRGVPDGDGDRRASSSTASRWSASTRPTPTSRACVAPRAAMRRLVAEVREATGLSVSIGIGPNKLVAKVASDAEKPAGFVVLTPRGGVRALRRRVARARARHRPAHGASGWRRWGSRRSGALASGRRRAAAARASAPGWGRGCADGRASRTAARSPPRRASRCPSRGRRPSTPTSPQLAAMEAALRRLAGELCEGLQRHGRRGRTIAIKVRLERLHDGDARADAARARRTTRGRVGRPRGRRSCASTRRRGPCGCWACASRRSPTATRRGAGRRRGRVSSRCPCRLARWRTSRVDGRDLHYLRRGEGEPLLLIQGMSGTHVVLGRGLRGRARGRRAGAHHLRPPRRRATPRASTARSRSSAWPTTPPGCSTRSGSQTRTSWASRWAAWSPRSSRCGTPAGCAR